MINQVYHKNATELIDLIPEGSIQLIYIDPPYFTKRVFSEKMGTIAYTDKDVSDLLTICTSTKKILSNSGLICIQVDYRLQHYVRQWLDRAYGESNFVNQIIWTYNTGGSTKKHLSRKHDYLIVYSKTKNYTFNPMLEKSYNRDFKPYRFKGVKEYQDQEGKWYTLVNMKDVWSDIPALGRTSGERNGYPTQKPLKLSDRVIQLFSNENDIVCDLFCGSGTTLLSAKNNNRQYIGCDINENAVSLARQRLS